MDSHGSLVHHHGNGGLGGEVLAPVVARGARVAGGVPVHLDPTLDEVHEPVGANAGARVDARFRPIAVDGGVGDLDEEHDVVGAGMAFEVVLPAPADDREVRLRFAVSRRDGGLNPDPESRREHRSQELCGDVDRGVVGELAGQLRNDPSFEELDPLVTVEQAEVDEPVVLGDGEAPYGTREGGLRLDRRLRGHRGIVAREATRMSGSARARGLLLRVDPLLGQHRGDIACEHRRRARISLERGVEVKQRHPAGERVGLLRRA